MDANTSKEKRKLATSIQSEYVPYGKENVNFTGSFQYDNRSFQSPSSNKIYATPLSNISNRGPNPAGQTSGGMGFNTNTTQSNPFAPKTSTFGQWSTPFNATNSAFGSGQSPAFVQSTSAYGTATSPFGAQSSSFGGPNPAAHSHTSNGIGFSNSSPFGASSSNSIPFRSTPPFSTPTSILGTTHEQGAIPSFASAFYLATPSLYLQPTQNSVEFGFWTPAGGTLRIIGQNDNIVQMSASQTPSVRYGILDGDGGRYEYCQQGDKGANPSFATSSTMGYNHTTVSSFR